MSWVISDQNVYITLFRICAISGLVMGILTFALIGHILPGKDRKLGHRLIGIFFGVGICLAMILLGNQMTSGRFTEVSINDGEVVLTDISDNPVPLVRDNIYHITLRGEKSQYLTITKKDGEQLKGGPCNDKCGEAEKALNEWLGPDPLE